MSRDLPYAKQTFAVGDWIAASTVIPDDRYDEGQIVAIHDDGCLTIRIDGSDQMVLIDPEIAQVLNFGPDEVSAP